MPDRMPSSLRPVVVIRLFNAKGQAAHRLAAQRKARARVAASATTTPRRRTPPAAVATIATPTPTSTTKPSDDDDDDNDSGEQAQQNLLPGVSVNSSKKSEDD